MSQSKKDQQDTDAVKTIGEKSSPINFKKTRSIMNDEYDSDEEIMVTVDEPELHNNVSSAVPKVMEVFTCLSYCGDNQTLCAGTNQGNLYIWKRNIQGALSEAANATNEFDSMENFWHLVNIANVRGAIKHCSWGVCDVSTPCVLVNCISNVFILKVGENVIWYFNQKLNMCKWFFTPGTTVANCILTDHLDQTEIIDTTLH